MAASILLVFDKPQDSVEYQMMSPDLLLSAEIPGRLNTLVFLSRISVLRGEYRLNSWLYAVFLYFNLAWDKKLALFEE